MDRRHVSSLARRRGAEVAPMTRPKYRISEFAFDSRNCVDRCAMLRREAVHTAGGRLFDNSLCLQPAVGLTRARAAQRLSGNRLAKFPSPPGTRAPCVAWSVVVSRRERGSLQEPQASPGGRGGAIRSQETKEEPNLENPQVVDQLNRQPADWLRLLCVGVISGYDDFAAAKRISGAVCPTAMHPHRKTGICEGVAGRCSPYC
jgi:hypothetical protein